MPVGTLLYRGAEADVIKGVWCGIPAVYKVRKRLPYRLPLLDEEIRRQRTTHEAQMISAAKAAGVRTPHLYYVDMADTTIVMEYVEGPRMKDRLEEAASHEAEGLFEEMGEDVAKLHSAGIVHGDLTTANVVLARGGLAFLDFGLASHASRMEDRAVDLRLIKETIVGAHSDVAEAGMRALLRGYSTIAGASKAKAAEKQLRSIERRGRYARVE